MGERMYRDEIGAAVERVAQLEEENARLREELRELRSPRRPVAARAKNAVSVLLLLSMTFALLGAMVAARSACGHRRASRRAHVVSVQRGTPRVEARPRTEQGGPEITEIRGGNDCSIPYYYDSNGGKHFKSACVGLRRSAW